MSVYGIPYTPYQIRTGSYSKKDIQTMVVVHLSWEAMNYFGYQIGVRHTLPRMAQHHAGSMAAARAQTAYPSALQGVIKTVTHMNPFALMATAGIASAVYLHTNPAPTVAMRSEPGETSWWRSVAQALTGTGPGIGGADVGI